MWCGQSPPVGGQLPTPVLAPAEQTRRVLRPPVSRGTRARPRSLVPLASALSQPHLASEQCSARSRLQSPPADPLCSPNDFKLSPVYCAPATNTHPKEFPWGVRPLPKVTHYSPAVVHLDHPSTPGSARGFRVLLQACASRSTSGTRRISHECNSVASVGSSLKWGTDRICVAFTVS